MALKVITLEMQRKEEEERKKRLAAGTKAVRTFEDKSMTAREDK